MTNFIFERSDYLSDRAFVEVDDKYSVVIIRTDQGLIIDVYPNDWDAPIDTMGIHDNDVAEAEQPEEE